MYVCLPVYVHVNMFVFAQCMSVCVCVRVRTRTCGSVLNVSLQFHMYISECIGNGVELIPQHLIIIFGSINPDDTVYDA